MEYDINCMYYYATLDNKHLDSNIKIIHLLVNLLLYYR